MCVRVGVRVRVFWGGFLRCVLRGSQLSSSSRLCVQWMDGNAMAEELVCFNGAQWDSARHLITAVFVPGCWTWHD